jgi:hypothetical protein
MELRYGLSRAVPEQIGTAWGARLIPPADFLHNRQDVVAASDAARAALIEWLNRGPLRAALDSLRDTRLPEGDQVAVVFEDERGKIVGSTNRDSGYVYLAAWLKPSTSTGEQEQT